MNRELFNALESDREPPNFEELHRQFPRLLCDFTFQGDSALHIAARKGHLDLVKGILAEKPSLANTLNEDDNTPLHEAAKSGNTEIVKILLRQKQSFYGRYNKFGETALVIASQYGHVATVRRLLEARTFEDKFEWDRSVGEAAYRGYRDVVVAMLDKEPSYSTISFVQNYHVPIVGPLYRFFNPRKFAGRTIPETPILHAAVQGGHLEIVKAILDHHSWRPKESMGVKDEYGRCAVHVAAMKGCRDIIDKFKSTMPDSLDIRSLDHKSVLHFAVENDQFEVVNFLLQGKEAKKVVKMVSRDHDCSRNTALHMAAKHGVNRQILECLLSPPDVDVNALNDEGMSALDIASAAAPHNPNCAFIAQRLEGAGATRFSLKPESITTSSPPKQGRDIDTVNTHMVVASLIATITFAVIFQIPGGIEDDKESIHYGAAKLVFDKAFQIFLFSDTVAFLASVTVVTCWLLRQHLQDSLLGSFLSNLSEASLLVSILWTVVVFVTAIISIIIPRNFERLKTKDKEVFRKYERILVSEMTIAVITPFVIAITFRMASKFRIRKISSTYAFLFFQLSYLIFIVCILSVGTKSY